MTSPFTSQLPSQLISQAREGKLTSAGKQFAKLGFCEAADRFLEERALTLAARSIRTIREHWKHARVYFGSTSISRIDADHVHRYLAARKAAGASNRTLNLELGVIRGILKRAKRWHLMAEDVKTLPEKRNSGRAMTPAEKTRLLVVARTRPEWQVVRLAMTLALNTTMRPSEIRGLLWRDIDLFRRVGNRP